MIYFIIVELRRNTHSGTNFSSGFFIFLRVLYLLNLILNLVFSNASIAVIIELASNGLARKTDSRD
jgi:hypothetical protein